MIYVLISIICSVTVGVLFKFASRYSINIQQAIAWNYLTAIVLSLLFFKPDVQSLTFPDTPIYYILGILLPTIFWILSKSVKDIGIARTDIAQRLSLIIPLLAAYLIFQESFSALKVAGLVVAFVSVVLMLINKAQGKGNSRIIFPILVFIGFGTVDILFKQIAADVSRPYTTILLLVFCIAFPIALAAAFYQKLTYGLSFKLVNLGYGMLLGMFNFSNIFFYLKAHRALSSQPSVVFASMNIGVVVMGTILGYFLFREKLNKLNFAGVALAVMAIVMITIAQYYGK
jgi:drug/metabolite transporter (DMT)-like permease